LKFQNEVGGEYSKVRVKDRVQQYFTIDIALGGVVVSVLATGPKVRGFNPGRGRWILRVIKSVARLPSEGK
jgi:hypothetical protein